MRIRSAKKDFYDFVAHQFGGGDPQVPYHRDMIRAPNVMVENRRWPTRETITTETGHNVEYLRDHQLNQVLGYAAEHPTYNRFRNVKHGDKGWDRACIVINNAFYIADRPWTYIQEFGAYTGEYKNGAYVAAPIGTVIHSYASDSWVRDRPDDLVVGKFHPKAKLLTDLCKSPVFLVDRNQLHLYTPVLADYGLASVLDPYQTYQEIAMHLTTLLGEDREKPNTQTDIQKVESHGFDKKQSFRHRK